MAFPFGVSISDFLSGIKLIKTSVEAFSQAHGARADYAELSRSVGSLERALAAAEGVVLDTQPRRDALKETVEGCKICITGFLEGIGVFECLNSRRVTRSRFRNSLRKIQWATCKRDDVMTFRSKIEMHVSALDMLLLSFQVETLMRLNTNSDSTNRIVLGIQSHVEGQGTITQNALTRHSTRIASLEGKIVSQSSAAASNTETLQQIQEKLQSALSPEDQKHILHLLQETLKRNKVLEREMEDLKCQNRCLERHMVEIKATLQLQKNVPPQVLLQKPVILHDALGRIVPFHLEFINSAAALKAVLKVRFQHVRLWKILANEYGLRDSSKGKNIDLSRAWESKFLPGQHIEMSIWYPDDESNNCPGCGFQSAHSFKEGEQTKCPKCPMIYRQTQLPIHFHKPESTLGNPPESQYGTEDASSFCSVDLVKGTKKKPVSCSGTVPAESKWEGEGWYCPECRDGPNVNWDPCCSNCSYMKG